VHQLHLQLVLRDQLLAAAEFVALLPPQLVDLLAVLLRGLPQDRALGVAGAEKLAGAIAGGRQHLPHLDPPIAAHDHLAAARIMITPLAGEFTDKTRRPVANHIPRFHDCSVWLANTTPCPGPLLDYIVCLTGWHALSLVRRAWRCTDSPPRLR